MNIIDRVKPYNVDGSDGTCAIVVALTHSAAIKLMQDVKGHHDGVTYTATELQVEDTGANIIGRELEALMAGTGLGKSQFRREVIR